MSFRVAATKCSATSSEASISTRVAVRVLRIETAPASAAARRLIAPTAMRSCVLTGRSYQNFCSMPRCNLISTGPKRAFLISAALPPGSHETQVEAGPRRKSNGKPGIGIAKSSRTKSGRAREKGGERLRRPLAEGEDARYRHDEADRDRDNDERGEVGVRVAIDCKQKIEILGLKLARHERDIHQRRHQSKPGGALSGRGVDGDDGERRDHAELGKRRRRGRIDEGDGAGAEAERRLCPLIDPEREPDARQGQNRADDRQP